MHVLKGENLALSVNYTRRLSNMVIERTLKIKNTTYKTNTITNELLNNCHHENGWYVYIKFWIFGKRVFVCSDCGDVSNSTRNKNK